LQEKLKISSHSIGIDETIKKKKERKKGKKKGKKLKKKK